MNSRQHQEQGTPVSYYISEEMASRVRALGLEQVVEQLVRDGYAVIPEGFDAEATDRIRAAILSRAKDGGPANLTGSAPLLLGTDPVFEEAILNPKVLAVVELTCGKGALLSQLLGSVRRPGPEQTPLHADQSWMPAPFPQQSLSITMCLVCDEYTREGGATKVIPGSHRHRRFPTPEEAAAEEGAVPIECGKGSVAIWMGETWHGSYPRLIEGERVVLHMTFSRISLRPVENYEHLDEAWLEGKPAELRQLLGRDDFLDKKNVDRNGAEYLRRIRNTQAWGRENTFYIKY